MINVMIEQYFLHVDINEYPIVLVRKSFHNLALLKLNRESDQS